MRAKGVTSGWRCAGSSTDGSRGVIRVWSAPISTTIPENVLDSLARDIEVVVGKRLPVARWSA
jgi:hypothetical protein